MANAPFDLLRAIKNVPLTLSCDRCENRPLAIRCPLEVCPALKRRSRPSRKCSWRIRMKTCWIGYTRTRIAVANRWHSFLLAWYSRWVRNSDRPCKNDRRWPRKMNDKVTIKHNNWMNCCFNIFLTRIICWVVQGPVSLSEVRFEWLKRLSTSYHKGWALYKMAIDWIQYF